MSYQWVRPVQKAMPNGVNTDYKFNANSWPTEIKTSSSAGTLALGQYAFDKAGNITGKTTEHGNYAYGYDSTYQLTSVANPGLNNEAYTYDKAGNRLTDAATSGPWTYNADNALTALDNTAFEYDNNGNTVKKTVAGVVTLYHYDTANRLASVDLPDGTVAAYKYDPFGRRMSKTITTPSPLVGGAKDITLSAQEGWGEGVTTYYIYSDEGLIGEYDATGSATKTYAWRPDGTWGTDPLLMQTAGQTYYYHNDHLGTPQKMTDEAGSIVWSAQYSAFGQAYVEAGSTVTNNLRFPGQYFDQETGLHYNYHRYYNPQTGRYTQTDPIGFGGGDANLWRYAGNNVVNLMDNDGLEPRGGERGATGGTGGKNTNNPYKHCREINPPQRGFVECKNHQTGKWVKKPRPASWPFPVPANNKKSVMCGEGCQDKILTIVYVGGTSYIAYRCIRMLPSVVFPPLWPTIPANVVIP